MTEIRAWEELDSPRDAVGASEQRMSDALDVLRKWAVVIDEQPDVYAMKALSELAAVREQVNEDLRLLAEYTVLRLQRTRNSVAKAAGVANTTVNAWVANPSTIELD